MRPDHAADHAHFAKLEHERVALLAQHPRRAALLGAVMVVRATMRRPWTEDTMRRYVALETLELYLAELGREITAREDDMERAAYGLPPAGAIMATVPNGEEF